jgi:hypothetical protein
LLADLQFSKYFLIVLTERRWWGVNARATMREDEGKLAPRVALISCDAASYFTGSAFLVGGGWTAIAIDGPPTGLTQTHQG